MTICTIPNRPTPKEERNINAILANFDAITRVVNGELDEANIRKEAIVTALLANKSVTTAKLASGAGVEAWQGLTPGAKVEAAGETQVPGVRLEGMGTVARLRGSFTVKAGEELKNNETLFTLPAGTFPPVIVRAYVYSTNESGKTLLNVAANGVVSCSSNLGAGSRVFLDSVTYNLT